jgi:hypothetical protein
MVLAGVVSGLIVAFVLTLAALMIVRAADASGAYSVAAVRAHLRDRPDQWVGRTVQLRALLLGCPPLAMTTGPHFMCSPTFWQPELADPAGPGARDPLPVTWGGPELRLGWLRGLPLVGKLMPGPQTVRWGVPATYKVRLTVAAAQTLCGSAVCYEGVLLDTGG